MVRQLLQQAALHGRKRALHAKDKKWAALLSLFVESLLTRGLATGCHARTSTGPPRRGHKHAAGCIALFLLARGFLSGLATWVEVGTALHAASEHCHNTRNLSLKAVLEKAGSYVSTLSSYENLPVPSTRVPCMCLAV